MTKITEKAQNASLAAEEEVTPIPPTENESDTESGIILPEDATAVEQVSATDRLLGFDNDGNPTTVTAEQIKEFATDGLISKEALDEALEGKANVNHIHGHFPTNYSGEQIDPGYHFNNEIGLKLAMMGNLGIGSSHVDVVWINGYSGNNLPYCHALLFPRRDKEENEMYIACQRTDSNSFGTPARIWHSGNFDADNVIKYLGRGTLLGKSGAGHGFTDFDTPTGQNSSFLRFGLPGYEIEICLAGYSAWKNGWNRLYFRSKDGDSGNLSDWKEFYHTGNLTPATAASVGLMSAADKVKLNAMSSAMALSLGEPATLALESSEVEEIASESTVPAEVTVRAQRSAQYQMQTDELLYDALEAFARNHPEFAEFAEWLAAKDRIRQQLAKPETPEGGAE